MSLHDKFTALASDATTVLPSLGAGADALSTRLKALNAHPAIGNLDALIQDAEKAVAAADAAHRQLTNGDGK